jgi:hypothetical protein
MLPVTNTLAYIDGETKFYGFENTLLQSKEKKSSFYKEQLKNSGPGKSTYPLSANANVLNATLRFSQKYVRPYYDVSVGVTLTCYQQAGSDGKYIGISGK